MKKIKIKRKTEELESELDEGMIGFLVDLRPSRHDGVSIATISTKGLDSHNDPLMKPNYYDENGLPRLTAKESEWWPKNDTHKLYINEGQESLYYEFID